MVVFARLMFFAVISVHLATELDLASQLPWYSQLGLAALVLVAALPAGSNYEIEQRVKKLERPSDWWKA